MIENSLLTASISTIFAAPGSLGDLNVQSAVTTIIFCNVLDPDTTPPIDDTVNEAFIDVYIVKAGQSASSTVNMIIKNLRVPAGETIFFDTERVVLSSGDTIQAKASLTDTVVATVSVLPV